MPDEKIKIKDLAASMNVQMKDVLKALRELGMPAKSTVGTLTAEEAASVRSHCDGQRQSNVERTEVRDVIVRRRRTKPGEAEPAPAPQPRPSLPKEPTEETTVVRQRPPRQEKPAEPVADAKGADKDAADKDTIGKDTSGKDAAKETSGKETHGKDREREKPREGRKKKTPRIETPPAKVLSRPGMQPDAPAEPPAEGPKDDTAHVADVPSPQDAQQTQDLPQTPEAPKESRKPQEHSARPPRTSRLMTADASASPDAMSTTSLSARARELDNRKQEGANLERSDAGRSGGPKVRIISRPPAGTAQEAPSRPGQPPRRAAGTQEREGTGRPRPQRTAGTGAGAGRQAPGQTAPGSQTDSREGQSRKKRLKGARRTVDFQQPGFGPRDDDDAPRGGRSTRTGRPGGRRQKQVPQPAVPTTQPIKQAKRKIRIDEAIRVADMAHTMGLKANEIIKVLFGMGVMATINQALDIDTATLVAAEFGYEVEKVGFSEEEYLTQQAEDAPEKLKPRPPVVTIMGHVDHGKTSLLDAIRKTNVTGGEAGGITQHIGAYHVKTKRGEIVFLDTPGHEAFTAMRARGAQITDLVVLVVAADDGVMEQTKEAINHSKAAKVPIMVAVNKMDKPGADPDRVLRELAELGLQAEDWGGDTIVAKVSAKTRQGLDELLEMVALQSEIMELKANPDKPARGHIVEARLDKGRGPVATVLIQEGTLKPGDNFLCGAFSGRVRALTNDQGKKVKEAGPSLPVEVQGIDGVPEAGEEFLVLADEKMARRIADSRAMKQREKELSKGTKITLESFLEHKASDQETLVLNLVVKADVQGSLEAITEALNKLSTEKVRLHIMHGAAGAITESDVMLASASQAIIIGFNVRPTAKVKEMADHENVDVRFYDIIYKLVDDIKSAMAGLLAPVQREVYLGQAEVRKIYSVPKVGTVAGSYVSDGKITRNAGIRLLREGVVVHTGKIDSLKRFKDDAREVVKGNECGISLENFNDIKEGDIIDAFETVEEAATL
ncbi:MAG: translation initiation factor IF-2 [Desulfovibrio sp.]|jgi:translation initiation factor IF-2|nr:translation initiation factor IF-2 [Desulfovibrio sp.]